MAEAFMRVLFHVEKETAKEIYFLPECRLSKGYENGARAKKNESGIQDYWTALDKLLAMARPPFRRRNKNGKPGTVTCEHGDIEEVSRSFIESERAKHGG
ncbi:hypothetical protein K6W76_22695 [Burkholderia anthina]|uniref:hypothetical protein n=1 Tax=Burkholderia anthina TaxID=179879 RepID=UPI00158DCD80|nr:hypothetical protein [Burkholderia anthina]MBY4869286.1 hypothetical protein [Burkholderia anthina]